MNYPDSNVILDNIPHAIMMVGADNFIQYANHSCEDFLKSSVSFICKKQFDYFLPYSSPVIDLIDQVRKNNITINEYNLDVSSPRLGSEKLVDVYCAPVSERPGIVVIQFIQRSVVEKLDKQLSNRGAGRVVSGLAAMLAHEIKNPLSGIRGAAQLLEMSGDDDDRQLTQLIKDETDRIVNLVNKMEVFSDNRPIDTVAVNIHAILEQVKKLAQAGFAKNIEIIENYDPSLPLIQGNRDELIQVFLNLIKNACEALEIIENPSITLKTRFNPGVRISINGSDKKIALPIELSICDNANGIGAEVKPHIFEPFVTTKTNGTGLGLALVSKIIGNHAGVIECDSNSEGTTFKIFFPIFQSHHENKIMMKENMHEMELSK